jgi:NADH-quinone oxidoreductase subunit J
MMVNILFYIFSSVLLVSSIMVITAQNAIYSVLFLVFSFLSSACLLFLLKCEFLSLMFILIYVGAIAILFLFVVMMLDLKQASTKKDTLKYFPFGFVIGSVFLTEMALVIGETFKQNPYRVSDISNFYTNWYDKIDVFTEIQAIGQVTYTQFVLQFLIAGNVLLLATLAAVVLTINTSTMGKDKTQVIFKQLSRNYKNVLVV